MDPRSSPAILSIPQYLHHLQASTNTEPEPADASDTEPMDAADNIIANTANNNSNEDGIGEFDDGKTGKLTLSILLAEGLIEPGDGVMSIDYLGQSFKGDLLSVGKIRSVETGLIFNNPSAWAIYCKKIINPAKKSGCGWASIKYRGRKMDYFKTIWLKRKAQREAEAAKNEAAQALTALSNSAVIPLLTPVFTPTSSSSLSITLSSPAKLGAPTPPVAVSMKADRLEQSPSSHEMKSVLLHRPAELPQPREKEDELPLGGGGKAMVIRHSRIAEAMTRPRDYHVELESFLMEGKMQPFTVSVSTSAMLILDLHSHLPEEDVCGYLAGHWDPNSHNLAITNTFPCLISRATTLEEAQRIETEIYDQLYGNNLSLVGWYHSSPRGPALPTVKDCFDQLDFQIKLLGNGDATYTPCVGLICAPYEPTARTLDSSIVVYWIYPPSETNPQDYGKPMRMSYSAITDPCLSEEVLQQIDKTAAFYRKQPNAVPFLEKYGDGLLFIDKLGKSLVSKFPQDQDEELWKYIRAGIVGEEEKEESTVGTPRLVNGRKESIIEEEIDDDEETALRDDQEEIDDDEENAIASRLGATPTATPTKASQPPTYSPLSYSQVISTSPPRIGNNGELDLRIPAGGGAETITIYSHHEHQMEPVGRHFTEYDHSAPVPATTNWTTAQPQDLSAPQVRCSPPLINLRTETVPPGAAAALRRAPPVDGTVAVMSERGGTEEREEYDNDDDDEEEGNRLVIKE